MSDHPIGYAIVPVEDIIEFGEVYLKNRNFIIENKINKDREDYNKKWYSRFFEFDEKESRFKAELTGSYWASCVKEALNSAKGLKSKNIETIFISTEILSCMYRFETPSSNTVE